MRYGVIFSFNFFNSEWLIEKGTFMGLAARHPQNSAYFLTAEKHAAETLTVHFLQDEA